MPSSTFFLTGAFLLIGTFGVKSSSAEVTYRCDGVWQTLPVKQSALTKKLNTIPSVEAERKAKQSASIKRSMLHELQMQAVEARRNYDIRFSPGRCRVCLSLIRLQRLPPVEDSLMRTVSKFPNCLLQRQSCVKKSASRNRPVMAIRFENQHTEQQHRCCNSGAGQTFLLEGETEFVRESPLRYISRTR